MQREAGAGQRSRSEGPLAFLAERLPALDLTALARSGKIIPCVAPRLHETDASSAGRDVFDSMTRVLYRQHARHLLITGPKGVGKTALVRELARRAASGEIRFLADRRFLWLDVSNVGPEDSRGCLETILMTAAAEPNVILCLDGLGALLKRPQGGSNKPLLRAAASRESLQIIGILSRWDYNDLIGSDAEMLELFTRLEIEEPTEETALAIARHAARGLEQQHKLTLPDKVIERAVLLGSNFILNQAHPAKAIRILQQACSELHYERSELGQSREVLSVEDVTRIVAEQTGIPQASLAGEDRVADYEGAIAGWHGRVARASSTSACRPVGQALPDGGERVAFGYIAAVSLEVALPIHKVHWTRPGSYRHSVKLPEWESRFSRACAVCGSGGPAAAVICEAELVVNS